MGVDPEVTKRCTKCGQIKPITKFYENGTGKWRGDCKECVKARSKVSHNAEKSRERQAGKYGLSLKEAEALWGAEQCEICGDTDPKHPTGSFNIDHCHTSGVVRGALCSWCNWGLGHFRDRPDLLRKAADYIDRHV